MFELNVSDLKTEVLTDRKTKSMYHSGQRQVLQITGRI